MNEFELYFSQIHNQQPLNIDFNQFQTILKEYVEKVMSNFLGDKAQCQCHIRQLKKRHEGSETYIQDTNTFIITINKDVAKSIYEGNDPFNIFVVFHEIAQAYDDFRIGNKDFKDANLKKICIEEAIIKSMITGKLFYYSDYEAMAIEAHANLIATQLTRDFYKKCNIELNDKEQIRLLFLEFFSLRKLADTNRNYEYLFDGFYYNSYKLPLNVILSEIEKRYPLLYKRIKMSVGEENIILEEDQISEFEAKVYEEYAIFELSEIINNPLFRSLVKEKTQYRPRI